VAHHDVDEYLCGFKAGWGERQIYVVEGRSGAYTLILRELKIAIGQIYFVELQTGEFIHPTIYCQA
jgi:hypothetical protein